MSRLVVLDTIVHLLLNVMLVLVVSSATRAQQTLQFVQVHIFAPTQKQYKRAVPHRIARLGARLKARVQQAVTALITQLRYNAVLLKHIIALLVA